MAERTLHTIASEFSKIGEDIKGTRNLEELKALMLKLTNKCANLCVYVEGKIFEEK